ncbi:MAG: GerMN domain-containing protein [Christensenellales bacterium]|jgi:spore germination protein GerM
MNSKWARYIRIILLMGVIAAAVFLIMPAGTPQGPDEAIEKDGGNVQSYVYTPVAIDNAQYEESVTEETVALYLPSQDFSSASTYVQTIYLSQYETLHEGAVKEILRGIRSIDSDSSPINLYLLSFVKTDSIISVNLSGNTDISDIQLFAVAYCITNTLTEFADVSHVNILMDDKAISINGIPYGALSYFENSLQIEFWQLSNKVQALLTQSDIAPSFNLPVSLYYGASPSLLVGEVRDIACYADTVKMVPYMIEELAKGPRDASRAQRLLPAEARLYSLDIDENESGALSIRMSISGAVSSHFARSRIEPRVAVAAIAMSLFDFYPNVDDVSIYFTDGLQSEYSGITRPGCELLLGSTITVYYPYAEGGMALPVEKTVPSYTLSMPDTLLGEMLSQPSGLDVSGIFPPNTDASDIMSISQQEGVAHVNVSERFLRELRNTSAETEKTIIYCIVNTICDNKKAKQVLFMAEGFAGDNPPGRINLSEPLYYNPGIIIKQ